MFFLLAIAAYAWYGRKPEWRRYLLVAALFAAGLMAKPMVITLPFVLLLLDYWPLERIASKKIRGSSPAAAGAPQISMARLALEKVPLLALSAASAWITLVAQRSGHAVRNFEEFPFGVRLENALVAYGLYLWKMIWPARLAVLYPHAANALAIWQVVLSTLILLAVTVMVLVFREKRYLAVGWFWFLGTLVPVIGLVQVGEAAMADRYAYIPLIGIFIMIAWGLDDWAQAGEFSLLWRAVPAVCVVLALGFVTFRQIGTWESEYTLWAHAVEVTEGNPYAHAVLGKALLNPDVSMTAQDLQSFDTEQKRAAEARRHLEEALASYRELVRKSPDTYLPDMATTLANLGNIAVSQNHTDEARQDYEEAMQYYHQLEASNPEPHLQNIATTLNNLAGVNRSENRIDEAGKNYEEALEIYRRLDRLEPGSHEQDEVTALITLGSLEGATGQTNKAYGHFEEALTLGRQLAQQNPGAYLPNLANRLNNFGTFEREHNRFAEARAHYEEALKIYRQLGVEQSSGLSDSKDGQAGSGMRWLPEMAITLNNLGDLDMRENRRDDARREFEGALDLSRKLVQRDPDHYLPSLAGALNNLGRLDGLENRLDEAREHFEGASEIYHRLAQRDPRFLPDLAGTLNSLAIVARLQKHPDASLGYYTQAMGVYRVLAQHDPSRFSSDVARVGASVAELERERHR
jgi:tetratricopeptide (TPR) repeat protein